MRRGKSLSGWACTVVAQAAAVLAWPAVLDASTPAVRVEQTDARVSYSGTWYPSVLDGHSGGSAALAGDAGARATLTFNGTGVSWIGYRDEWSGIANVYIDGALAAAVDTYASPAQYQAVLFTRSGLAAGSHTISIQVTHTRNAASGGVWIWVDAFDVTSPPPPTLMHVEEQDALVSYGGTWYANAAPGHSGGSAVLAADAGARATLTFVGTGVSWTGYRDEWSGIARVYVDGVLAGTVDTYASPAQYQALLFSVSGLAAGTHTISIEATETQAELSGGPWVWVDAFDVTGSSSTTSTPTPTP